MKWEEEVGEGWRPFVKIAIEQIENLGGKITQVKEKFGGLRIYFDADNRIECDKIVTEAEYKAEITCEYCGQPGKILNRKGWLKCCCKEHSV